MLFADDIVLIDVTRERINDKLARWRHTLEFRGFRVRNQKQNTYIAVSVVGKMGGEKSPLRVQIPKVEKFKYLGSIIQQNRDINEDINQCMKVG